MPVIFVLFSVLAAAGLATLVLRQRDGHATRSLGRAEHFIGSGTWSQVAGGRGQVGWPLVRLDIVPSGIVIGPTSRWWRWTVPQVEMGWADIDWVERRPTGIRINVKGAGEPHLLFQMHRDDVLAALASYPIELRAQDGRQLAQSAVDRRA
jgi:hypothetical protein